MAIEIPGSLGLKLLELIAYERLQELRRRRMAPGRKHELAILERWHREFRDMLGQRHNRLAAEIDAGSLGWLCAWAIGFPPARTELGVHLHAIRHPQGKATDELRDLADVARILFGLDNP